LTGNEYKNGRRRNERSFSIKNQEINSAAPDHYHARGVLAACGGDGGK